MPATLTIPPRLVERVREGAFALLAAPAEAIVAGALVAALPEPETRRQLQGALALLDLLDSDTGAMLEVPASPLLLASVEDILPKLQAWFDELDATDERRPGWTEELRLLRQFHVLVQRAVSA
jgi:hypothetical protein